MHLNDMIDFLCEGLDSWPESIDAGIRICKTSKIAPLAYLHSLYPPLDLQDIPSVSEYLQRPVPKAYSAFLCNANGARLFGGVLSFFGHVHQLSRSSQGLGQPISLRYGNLIERPFGIAQEDFAIGGFVCSDTVIKLIMAQSGEVRAVHPRDGLRLVKTWENLNALLETELPRLAYGFDRSGYLKADEAYLLPVQGYDWSGW